MNSSDVAAEGKALEPGETVKFELGSTPHGRRALRVRRVSPDAEPVKPRMNTDEHR